MRRNQTENEHIAEGNRLTFIPRFGDVRQRHRDGGHRHRVEAEKQPGQKADAGGCKAGMLDRKLKRFHIHVGVIPQ